MYAEGHLEDDSSYGDVGLSTDPSQDWRSMMARFRGTESLREVREMPAFPVDSGTRSEFKDEGVGTK